MKIFYLTLLLSVVTFLKGYAQKIETQKIGRYYRFSSDGKCLKSSEMATMMKHNSRAYQFMNIARTQITTSSVLSAIGGGLVGWQLGSWIAGKPIHWGLFGGGAALVAIEFPIKAVAVKNALKAVDLYNAGLKTTSWKAAPTLNLKTCGNGIGFVLTF